MRRAAPFLLLAVVLALPPALSRFARHAEAPASGAEGAVALTVLSPHNESIRREFGEAFEAWHRRRTGREVRVDWRNVGGAGECVKYLNTRFAADFERREPALYGAPGVSSNLFNPARAEEGALGAARAAFRNSVCSSGLDVYFGGGADNFMDAAAVGQLVPALSPAEDAAVFAAIPESLRGWRLRDAQGRWWASALSGFGIVYNRDLLARAGVPEPREWADLCDGRLAGLVGLADPMKSGTAYKAYEGFATSVMRRELLAGKSREAAWRCAFGALTRLALNARLWADSASGPVFDTARGDVAAAMAADFYARAQVADTAGRGGGSRVAFVLPGDSPLSADPVAVLRGAPHAEVAREFVRFVLSREGQRLWTTPAGEPGGPARKTLFRLPVRADAYPENDATSPFREDVGTVSAPGAPAVSPAVLRLTLGAALPDVREELRAVGEAVTAARRAGRSGAADRAVAALCEDPAFSLSALEGAVKSAGGASESLRRERVRLSGARRAACREAIRLCAE